MSRARIQAIAFDMWGTLFQGGGLEQYHDILEALGNRDFDIPTFEKQMEISLMTKSWSLKEGMKELGKELGLKYDEEAVMEVTKRWQNWARRLEPFAETKGVLEALAQSGMRMVVISNTDSFSMPFKIESYGWGDFFEGYFLSTEHGVLKPHPKIFEAVEKHFGVPKGEILMVDDSLYHGVEPARKFGWQALWVARGKKGRDSARIENLKGILSFL